MSIPLITTLVTLAVASILLCSERVPVDVTALGVLVVLMVGGVLTPADALRGFSSDAVVAIGGIFVLTAGLRSSGALELLGRRLQRAAEQRPERAVSKLLALVAAVSVFINNTTCTAAFLPVAVTLSKRIAMPSSRVLMPLAFASILGGSISVVGTSTNVLTSGLLSERGAAPLAMFELAPVALPIALIGLVYLIALGPRLLPTPDEEDLDEAYELVEYLSEARVTASSPLIGRTVAGAGLGERWGVNVVGVLGGSGEAKLAAPDDRIQAGDRLLIQGHADRLLELARSSELEIGSEDETAISARRLQLGEAVVLPRSDLVGRSLVETRFRQRYAANVLAIHRHGESLRDRIGSIPIHVGDVLLVQLDRAANRRLLAQRGLLLVEEVVGGARGRGAAVLAPTLFALALLPVVFGWLPLAASVLLGCLGMVLTRCVTPQEAYAAIEWRLLVLIAGMIALGRGLETTGGAQWLADATLAAAGGLGPLGVLAAFFLLTVALTQPMSNQAAALVVLPVALEVAGAAGIGERAMAVTVAIAASTSFLTPLEPSCLLVYGPGRYRFLDFPRLGTGLTVIAFVATVALVPRFWPLAG
ncbi:MAG: SLC13 family permease [Acidobacteria bacterium]|nr:MAG: SLC13 family permease [Acidobacteriota bacterium]REK03721.1 MAG: SLC13 family permease [Acidobacteriota bacterium]